MSCCGRPPTPARDPRGTPSTDRQPARPAERREVAPLVRLRYVGTTSALVTGPAIGFLARAVGLTGALSLVGAAGLVITLLGPRLGSSA